MTALLLAACEPHIEIRGVNPEHSNFKDILIGKDDSLMVKEKLGSPSFTSLMEEKTGEKIWYYVYKKTSQTSFYKPETLEQKVTKVAFDKNDKVASISEVDGEVALNPSESKTQSNALQTTVAQDVFGGFGKYTNKKPSNKD